jgi:NhaP-type Na+/H+ and K+/H+ antiporter
VGLLAAWAFPADRDLRSGIPAHQRALYALGVGFLTYGTSLVPPHGNGLIAVYVVAITLGIRRPDIAAYFQRQSEDIVEIVKIGVFVVFGSLLTFETLFSGGWGAVAIVAVTLLLARPVAVFVALVRTRTDIATRAFMAWFGPKGVATITFSLLVLSARVPGALRLFHYAGLVVFCSIIAHGITDTPGTEWMARHSERKAEAERPHVSTLSDRGVADPNPAAAQDP